MYRCVLLACLKDVLCHSTDEERLETREAGEWTEDMASNEPLEGEEVDPDLAERLPSDRG